MSFIHSLQWQPQIGDPSIMGWATVAAYFLTAFLCFFVFVKKRADKRRSSWIFLSIFMVLLGFNKQLDLQSLFTEIGRYFARSEGLYESRRNIQAWFVAGAILAGCGVLGLLVYNIKKMAHDFIIPSIGLALLVTFIVTRAISFHHFETILKFEISGARMNWVFELGGISVIAIGSLLALRMAK